MIDNEELLREIERLEAENKSLRLQTQVEKRTRRPTYNHDKLTRIPEFEDIFWRRGDDGSKYLINEQWVIALGTMARATLFPQYTGPYITKRGELTIRYAKCIDLSSKEYLQYIEFLDDVFAHLAARASAAHKEANNDNL